LYEGNQRFELFSSASKQYVLYGMGFHTALAQSDLGRQEVLRVKRLRNETLHSTEKLLSALPTNRQFFSHLMKT
jgi:tryptophan halogenase